MKAATILQASEEDLLQLLQQAPTPPYSDELVRTWTLLHYLHPNEIVRETTAPLLQSNQGAEQLDHARRVFAIFGSVLEYLPWMGDYTVLQRNNIQYYRQHKDPYESLLMQSPSLVDRYLDLGKQLHLLFGLTEEAKQCLEDIETYHPELAEVLYALGRIADHEGEPRLAADYYQRCLIQSPDHLYALLELGLLHIHDKAYEEAIALHQRVWEQDPFLSEAHISLARAHHAIGDKGRAKQYLEAALGINAHHEEALYWTGIWQWQDDNDVEAAVETFEKGLDHPVHGDSALLLSGLAKLHDKQLNEPEKARIYYEKSLKVRPRDLETFCLYVQLLERHYQAIGEVQNQYERYITLAPTEPSIYLSYADFLVKYFQHHEAAYAILDNALNNGIESPDLKRRFEQLDELIDSSSQVNNSGDNNGSGHSAVMDPDDEDDDDDFSGGGAAGDN